MEPPVTNLIESEGFVIASATDLGRKRTGNEDSHALWISDDAAVRAKQGLLLVVCDGMGGASAGEVASRLAVDTVVEHVRASRSDDPAEVLREAIESANHVVHTQAATHADQRGMGTTCTALLLRGRTAWIGHVGDSRAYLVRGGKLRKLTRDHSLVAELIEQGQLTEAGAKHDHRRNVVTRSVGALADVEVDAECALDPVQPGDVLVLCSDGLHGQVQDAEIARFATECAPDEACTRLIALANERGGPDNITAIVARLGGAPIAAAAPRPAEAKRVRRKLPPSLGVLGAVLATLVLLVAVVGSMLFRQLRKPAVEPVAAQTSAPGEPARAEPAPERPATAGAASEPAPPERAAPSGAASATPVLPAREAPAPVHAARVPAASPAATPATAPASPAAGKPDATTAGQGTVRLMTRPFQPSTFYVDGEPWAQDVGFLTQSLSTGDHVVRVEGAGGASVDVPVHVEPGGSYSLVAEFPNESGLGNVEIVLVGAPHAQVLVDGAQYPEAAPCVVRGLTPGSHTIRVLRPRSSAPQGPAEVQIGSGTTTRAEYRFGAKR